MENSFQTPILLMIFNRPDVTKQVFAAIRKIKPTKLFIAADGARLDKKEEAELCEETRNAVQNIDWPCEVFRKYYGENHGGSITIELSINWFFEHVENGIILEDDCLPNDSFFYYCQELLEHYKDSQKVMNISGSNFQDGKKRGNASYYFSIYPSTWGWATWRRAWRLYDKNMREFPDFIAKNKIHEIVPRRAVNEQRYWLGFFQKEYSGKFIFWDVKWLFTIWSHGGIGIIPNYNLVTNIGFGPDATHTKGDLGLSIATENLTNIVHPHTLATNDQADRYHYRKLYKTNLLKKIVYKLRMMFA